MEYDARILEKTTNHAINLLEEGFYRVDLLSFCILAARELAYRFIIVLCRGMDFEETKERIAKLEQWPLPGRNPCVGIKEIWVPKENLKQFDIFFYEDGRWVDIRERTHCFNIDKLKEWFPRKPKIQPKMARGHIDTGEGCVYFLYAPNNKAVKIGKTTNLKNRLKSFKTTLPGAKLLGVIESQSPYELESDLHRRFAEYSIQGEWFTYCDEIKEFIRNHNV